MDLAVSEPRRHKELIFEVVGVAGQLDDRSRVGESGQIIKPVASPPLLWAGLEAEKVQNIRRSGDLPLVLQK